MKNALCLGTFDGVHIGHQEVLNVPMDYKKIAVTFSLPPKTVLSGSKELIMTYEDKIEAFKSLGVDETLTLNFEEVKGKKPNEFLDFLYKKFNPKLISCGFNYRFGKNAVGNTETLETFCKEKGIVFKCAKPVIAHETSVSSTLIRNYLKEGNLTEANTLLLKPFSFENTVIKGDARGRTIGFPTVNLRYPDELVKIPFGVYKTRILVDDIEYLGITNIGIRPTFLSEYIISETFIKDFSGDLYGKKVRVFPLEFLRKEIKFSSLAELKNQIIKDLKAINQEV